MLTEACDADAMKKSSGSEWHKRFKEGQEGMKDDERTGCLKTRRTDENVRNLQKLVHSDVIKCMNDGRGTKFRQRNCEEELTEDSE
jgi:hypothetical protein